MTTTVRHDWYQTDEKVVITVLLRNITDCTVDIQPNRVLLVADDKTLDLQLYKAIDAEKSSHKRSPVKMEITLTKTVGERWPSLVADKDEAAAIVKAPKIYKQDWDSFQKEVEKEEEEKGEGDALTNLFQKIYSSSTDEVRRAMNKSFSESGGTVLSTNWQEIGEKKTDVKPPDGTDFKKWE